jgi:hypothetical protein
MFKLGGQLNSSFLAARHKVDVVPDILLDIHPERHKWCVDNWKSLSTLPKARKLNS